LFDDGRDDLWKYAKDTCFGVCTDPEIRGNAVDRANFIIETYDYMRDSFMEDKIAKLINEGKYTFVTECRKYEDIVSGTRTLRDWGSGWNDTDLMNWILTTYCEPIASDFIGSSAGQTAQLLPKLVNLTLAFGSQSDPQKLKCFACWLVRIPSIFLYQDTRTVCTTPFTTTALSIHSSCVSLCSAGYPNNAGPSTVLSLIIRNYNVSTDPLTPQMVNDVRTSVPNIAVVKPSAPLRYFEYKQKVGTTCLDFYWRWFDDLFFSFDGSQKGFFEAA
jgi:hypothetical protein